jgi:hypothetical protein
MELHDRTTSVMQLSRQPLAEFGGVLRWPKEVPVRSALSNARIQNESAAATSRTHLLRRA